ncbi:MAG: glycosyltransferase family 2 protein [Candidatus Pacearchaeota archaeon]
MAFNFGALADVGFVVFIFALGFVLISTSIDSLAKRKLRHKPFVSFVMPSYNDAHTIREAVESVFDSYDKKHFELIIVNDNSSDNTREILNELRKKYLIKVINNKKNLGKAKSVNKAFRFSKGEIIFIIDSDMRITKNAVFDVLSRLENKKVGGASCRYVPMNKGFWAEMQRVEYGMLTLLQRSYNPYSTLAFWGGCMAIKRKVFEKVGFLSERCIIEDADLALKIGEAGWKAQESKIHVYSYVPSSVVDWFKQRMRWAAGGAQNIVNHFKFFATHPLVIFFFIAYSLLSISFVASLINNFAFIKNLYALFDSFRDAGYSFTTSFGLAKAGHGYQFLKMLGLYMLFPLFSVPYIFANYPVKKKPYALLLIFPFSIIYLPILTVVSLVGIIIGLYKVIFLGQRRVGWRGEGSGLKLTKRV